MAEADALPKTYRLYLFFLGDAAHYDRPLITRSNDGIGHFAVWLVAGVVAGIACLPKFIVSPTPDVVVGGERACVS